MVNLEWITELTRFDYMYLKGDWQGAYGAAYNTVSEDCRNSGLGSYGCPTERGLLFLKRYEDEHSATD